MNQISQLAFVHPEAKLGDNNIIGPFCYIDKNTVIGDNNVLQNGVTIHTGARIGNGNEFFPGASISTKPQDLKFLKTPTVMSTFSLPASAPAAQLQVWANILNQGFLK